MQERSCSKCRNGDIIYGQTLEQSEGKMLFFQFTNAHSIVRIFIDQKDK